MWRSGGKTRKKVSNLSEAHLENTWTLGENMVNSIGGVLREEMATPLQGVNSFGVIENKLRQRLIPSASEDSMLGRKPS